MLFPSASSGHPSDCAPLSRRHVANGEILGVTLLMEDVLQTGFQGAIFHQEHQEQQQAESQASHVQSASREQKEATKTVGQNSLFVSSFICNISFIFFSSSVSFFFCKFFFLKSFLLLLLLLFLLFFLLQKSPMPNVLCKHYF